MSASQGLSHVSVLLLEGITIVANLTKEMVFSRAELQSTPKKSIRHGFKYQYIVSGF